MNPFIQLDPTQVPTHWGLIKNCIAESMPSDCGHSKMEMVNILKDFTLGNLQCWFYPYKTMPPHVVLVTQFRVDHHSKMKSICIFSFCNTDIFMVEENKQGPIPDEVYECGYKQIEEFGRSEGAKKLILYTKNNKVKSMCRLMKFDEQMVFSKEFEEDY